MYCIRCGVPLPGEAAYCPSCGAPVAAATPVADAPPPSPSLLPGTAAPLAAAAGPRYAGFWRRFWSYVIDRFVLGVVFTPVGLLVLAPLLATESAGWTDTDLPAETLTAIIGAGLTVAFLAMLGSWLYYALLQSASRQATLGQMALGIRIADLEGRRVSFGRASGRYFATVLTGLTFGLGYLLMFLTARKQTLHDLVAQTVVLR
jgi:uncharacterized RDD family membrane protein YckC